MLKPFRVGPLVLIGLGSIFLLNNFGILPWSIWTNLWKFWPVIIILIGVEYLIGQAISFRTLLILLVLVFLIPILFAVNPFTKNPFATEKLTISESLGPLARAKIIIDIPTTNLKITSGNDPTKLINGSISFSKASNKPRVSTEETFGQAIVRITQDTTIGIPFISSLKNDTKLFLTEQIPLELQITTGASKEELDLSNLRIDYLEINSQASDLNIKFGNLYSSRARIKTKASNLTIQIPKGVEARAKVDSKVKNLNISDRFKEQDGEYKTQGFDKAFTRLDIQIESIAGSITIN